MRPSRSPGKERDSETGFDYFGARYFSSNMGRWMSPDWDTHPTAVPFADVADPQSLNLFIYVRNNPLSTIDPDGHCCEAWKALWMHAKQILTGKVSFGLGVEKSYKAGVAEVKASASAKVEMSLPLFDPGKVNISQVTEVSGGIKTKTGFNLESNLVKQEASFIKDGVMNISGYEDNSSPLTFSGPGAVSLDAASLGQLTFGGSSTTLLMGFVPGVYGGEVTIDAKELVATWQSIKPAMKDAMDAFRDLGKLLSDYNPAPVLETKGN